MRFRTVPESNYRSIFTKDGKTLRYKLDQSKPFGSLKNPDLLDLSLNNKCHAKCEFCFVPETLVRTMDENKPINQVKIGDKVFTYDEYKQCSVINVVEQLHCREIDEEILEIELENGERISVTKNHKFFTKRGWISAENLLETDELLDLIV